MKFQEVNYLSSYLFCPHEFPSDDFDEYNHLGVKNYNLFYSNDINVKEYKINESAVIVIGYIFDIRDPDCQQNEIAQNLLNSDCLIEELEYINGRYLLIISNENGMYLYSDASQLQPVSYHPDKKILGSHDNLIAAFLNKQGINMTRRPRENHSELDFTRYEEIFKFNPSLRLKLDDFSFERIYPRVYLQEKSVEETFNEMKPYLENSSKWLEKNGSEIFLTLTGGIDSRVSASLIRSFSNKVEFLTFFTPTEFLATPMAKKIHLTDRRIAEQFKKNMKWKQNIINLRDYRPDDNTSKLLRQHFNSHYSFALTNYYRNVKQYNHAFHVKSVVFGMGKGDFSSQLDNHKNTYEFFQQCIHGLPKSFNQYYDIKTEALEYFKRNLIDEEVTAGRHYFDMYHLESRMGNWHSVMTLETDPETDEFIFMNSRKMIDLMQQPSLEKRRNFDLYKTIVNHYWPVLLHFGINNEKNLFEQFKDTSKEKWTLGNLQIINESMMVASKNENAKELEIKPSRQRTNTQSINHFLVKNLKDTPVNFSIKSEYSNPRGKGFIKVIIRNDGCYKEYDILELNTPIDLEVDSNAYSIMILYNGSFKKPSWSSAGSLKILLK